MTTPRARLQEVGLDDLRQMANKVEIESDGVQKSKLIAAILESESFDESMIPKSAVVDEEPAKTQERS